MKDIWHALEERTRAWHALGRQGLATDIWADYVSVRFGRTGDPRALEYLYPYLNHAHRGTRLRAIEVAARVFEGRGPRAVDALDYFTKNPDLFLRDRSAIVVGAAVTGSPDRALLEILAPYLNHQNQFIRKLAVETLGKAAAGRGSARVLEEILRVAEATKIKARDVDMAIARTFSGRPIEEAYAHVAKLELVNRIDTGNQQAVAVLVRGASDKWYERACHECFEPRLHADEAVGWRRNFVRRDGIGALSWAAAGHGMEALNRMLHLRGERCTGHAMLHAAPGCFAGADPDANRTPLDDLMRNGDVPAQRIAAVCLGRMAMDVGDEESIGALRELCGARNKAVQAAALFGLGMAAKSTCDEELRKLCLDRASNGETASAAIQALGMIFLGSGRSDVFSDIRITAESYRVRPVRGKRHCKPLAACYEAAGLLYLGTGSTEAVAFLLDVLALPKTRRMDEYRWCAARALVMTEFSESALGTDYVLGRYALPEGQVNER